MLADPWCDGWWGKVDDGVGGTEGEGQHSLAGGGHLETLNPQPHTHTKHYRLPLRQGYHSTSTGTATTGPSMSTSTATTGSRRPQHVNWYCTTESTATLSDLLHPVLTGVEQHSQDNTSGRSVIHNQIKKIHPVAGSPNHVNCTTGDPRGPATLMINSDLHLPS